MNARTPWLLLMVLLIALVLPALALAANGYTLSWWTVDGGGHTRLEGAGSTYILGGTIGQPDAGQLTGGTYTLGGGFWVGGAAAGNKVRIYLPMVLRQVESW